MHYWRCHVERSETSRSLLAGASGRILSEILRFAQNDTSDVLLDIDSHRRRARNIFPTGALPEFSTAHIVVGHQDNSAPDANESQSVEALLHQTFTQSVSTIGRVHRHVIN